MPETAEVERVYSAMEEAARLVNITCSRDKVWPILTAYQDVLPEAVIVFSMAGGRYPGLDFTIQVFGWHGDPYATALSHGLIEATDHPSGRLLADIRELVPTGMYAIDGEVTGGFKKTYAVFQREDLQGLSTLADVPTMPRAVADNIDLLTRYGLNDMQMLSIDYKSRSVNLYLHNLTAEFLEPESIQSMLREMKLPELDKRGLDFAKKSFAIYPTFDWDSSAFKRITFAVISTDPSVIPARDEQEIALFTKFAKNAPYVYDDARAFVTGVTLTPGEEFYKLGSYYRITDFQRSLLKAFDTID